MKRIYSVVCHMCNESIEVPVYAHPKIGFKEFYQIYCMCKCGAQNVAMFYSNRSSYVEAVDEYEQEVIE